MDVGNRIELVAVSSPIVGSVDLTGPFGRLSDRKMPGIRILSIPNSRKPGSASRVSIKVIRLACSLRYDSSTGR